MKINKAFKYRIYPNKQQIKYIEGCFNACRYVYNTSLDCEQQLYSLGCKSNLTAFGLGYHLKFYKINDKWLENYHSKAFEFEMENLSQAYSKFFKGGGFPRFKSKKDSTQSFRTRSHIKVLDNAIKIPKVKEPIECVLHRPIEGKPKQMTISRKNGKYYVAIMCEIESDVKEPVTSREIGIDLGVKTFLTADNGDKIENPKFIRTNAEHLTKLQQKLAKTKKGSNNYNKLKIKIASLHEKIANKRNDFIHNVTSKIVSNYDIIYMEDLKIKNLTASAKGTLEKHGKNVAQKTGLNKSILDVSLGSFKTILEYKAKFNKKTLIKVGTFYPSSKLCNNCGHKNTNLILSNRIWTCENCNTDLDRDINASLNIKNEGRRLLAEKSKKDLVSTI